MALVKCPDCGKMVSSRVKVCPECGCPAEFFEIGEQTEQPITEASESIKEDRQIVFNFKQFSIKYPVDAELYAGLYGDYVKLGFEKFELLCDVYKKLGTADSVAKNLATEAQKMVDDQIDAILRDLYAKGLSMTMKQFKIKYGDKYPLDYTDFMDSFMENYNNILGLQQDMAHSRAAAYANRGRWVGGGFGMKGAVKGAVQAGVLNMGTSVLSGIGTMVVGSIDEGSIDKKKEKLYNNESIMIETCEGIITCMNGLFLAYTEELDGIGQLGNKINIDLEQANAKFESAMTYEKDRDKLFGTVVECLGLYPSSREFYDAIEMDLEDTEAWKAFKEYWHLDFLYKENERAFLKTPVKLNIGNGKPGNLKLLQDVLVFTGDDPADNKKIPIGSIKKVEDCGNRFEITIKGKFLLVIFVTPLSDIWTRVIEDAINGKYEKIDSQSVSAIVEKKKEKQKAVEEEAKAYILANYTVEQKSEAVSYYRKQVGASLQKSKSFVDSLFAGEKSQTIRTKIYPGTEEINKGIFEGEKAVLCAGDDDRGYMILTTRELIQIDVKKNRAWRYDIYKMSKLQVGLLGLIKFRYPYGALGKQDRRVSALGLKPSVVVEKIQNMQKGNF